ncbi:MAG: copper resistance CopC family protein [Burkholderiaceae bacterium]
MKTSFHSVLAAAAVAASPLAFAHPALVESWPAKGEVLDATPIEIRLTFNAQVQPRLSSIKLVSATGKRFDCDRPHADKANPRSIEATAPFLRSGLYRAHWTAAGGDGHRLRGEFSFSIK